MRARAFVLGIFASVATALPVHATVQRTFVASYGNDANTASNCSFLNPCRGFTAAQSVTSDFGEIVALDAAGYGAITITKSITITANPGFYAGIAASGGNGVTIATSSVRVVLRGLSINGVGGAHGVVMTAGDRISIENCVISNFAAGAGLFVNAAAEVRVFDSLFRDNSDGIYLDGGVTATVSGSKFLGHADRGVMLEVTGTTTNYLSVSDSQFSGNFVSLQASGSAAGGTARVAVVRSSLTNNEYGPTSTAVSGTSVVTVSSSLISGNVSAGTYQAGGGATLESLGNNTIRQNGAPTGTVTTVPQS